jgi:hypothetical protein
MFQPIGGSDQPVVSSKEVKHGQALEKVGFQYCTDVSRHFCQ